MGLCKLDELQRDVKKQISSQMKSDMEETKEYSIEDIRKVIEETKQLAECDLISYNQKIKNIGRMEDLIKEMKRKLHEEILLELNKKES